MSSPSTAPQARTHDIFLVGQHVKDPEELVRVLNKALKAAFPRPGKSRYSEVEVLLLCWEDDDLGVSAEVAELEKIFRCIFVCTRIGHKRNCEHIRNCFCPAKVDPALLRHVENAKDHLTILV
ncbi:MAG: hypothetical protein Q9181_005597 [Wetmoreana brouardii]